METALKLFITITGNRQQNSTLLQNVFYRKSFLSILFAIVKNSCFIEPL